MADSTGISWTDATWNPVRGCSRVSAGCQHCYAEVQAARIVRMGKGKPTAYDGLVKLVGVDREPRWTGVVRLVPEQLAWPLRKRKPLRIFVNSMSDLFHESLTNEQIAAVFGVMAACPQHTFQVLTKRAKRMREWFEWARREFTMQQRGIASAPHTFRAMLDAAFEELGKPHKPALDATWHAHEDDLWPLPNVWLGVSVENQEAADERIPELLATPAAVRFLSCEPLLGPVSLVLPKTWLVGATAKKILRDHGARGPVPAHLQPPPSLDWIIAGCESGPGARPCGSDWLRMLRDECAVAGVAFFLRQAVEPTPHEQPAALLRGIRHFPPTKSAPDGSKRKPGGVIELPYLDGIQHAAFPVSQSMKEVDMACAGCPPASTVVAAGERDSSVP